MVVLTDLDDPIDGVLEERAVVGHDGEGGGRRCHEPFEKVEAGEVEVVCRLVQEEHVEAREEDGGQARPRPLAARHGPEGVVEAIITQPDLGDDGSGARRQIVATQPQIALEGVAVDIGRARVPFEVGRRRAQGGFGGGDARPTAQVGEQRLIALARDLLR